MKPKVFVASRMLSRFAFAALCIAVIATQGFAFPQDDKKNELDNVISETDDAEGAVVSKAGEEGEASGVTSPPPPTTLTVGVASEAAPSSTAASPAKDHAPAPASTTHRPPSAANNFSRLIDDIFQIPISVLKAVNTLLSNPFRSKISSHE